MKKYEDIIHLPHPEPVNRRRMPLIDRAAQFAPFAALTGYEESIIETAKLPNERIEPDQERIDLINQSLNDLSQIIRTHPRIRLVYWEESGKDSKYVELMVIAKDMDEANRYLVLADRTKIRFDDLYEIELLNTEKE